MSPKSLGSEGPLKVQPVDEHFPIQSSLLSVTQLGPHLAAVLQFSRCGQASQDVYTIRPTFINSLFPVHRPHLFQSPHQDLLFEILRNTPIILQLATPLFLVLICLCKKSNILVQLQRRVLFYTSATYAWVKLSDSANLVILAQLQVAYKPELTFKSIQQTGNKESINVGLKLRQARRERRNVQY